jgi:class 3 adenylate cyclase
VTELASAGAPGGAALARGLEELQRHAWTPAFESLSQADREGALGARDLVALAEAAWFTGQGDLAIAVKERTFGAYQAEGDPVSAAGLALDLARDYGFKQQHSIAAGWLHRAERLLEGRDETFAHGYLALCRSDAARLEGSISEAVARAEEAVAIAGRTGQPDLRASALTALGMLKIAMGARSEGFALMEEAATAALSGELSAFMTGVTFCGMISACRDMTDYRRAAEWTQATERWCQRQSVEGFPGICRVHRAEVVALQGAWQRAEAELRQATDELMAFNATPPRADGFYALGEIRLRMGDLAGATEALRSAHALGRTPQPALALVRLAEGKVQAALAAIATAIEEASWDHLSRTRLLPAQVEIAVAAGDLVLARSAAEEFGRIVEADATPALEATRHETVGRVLLADGEAASAARELRMAIRAWRDVGAPYEVARAQALLARGLRSSGDRDAADLELELALEEFRRLGARLDAEVAEAELAAAAARREVPVQAHRTFLFTDIVGSTTLAGALGDAAWERLLGWHDETLRGLVAKGGGEVVKSTGDGFFVAFGGAREALECAAAIQRALEEHRRSSGFAPPVRMGLHTAEAVQRGSDYSGVGVHVAARVADLAGAGEIIASVETWQAAGRIPGPDVHEVSLKGVAGLVSIASVPWT